MPIFDFNQIDSVPTANPKPYNPGDYNLPVWRDEDHLPPLETVTAEQEPYSPEERKTYKEALDRASQKTGFDINAFLASDSMSIEAAKNKLCAWALSQVGYHEETNNWNKYANMAAVQRLYGGKIQNAPWCDLFTDAAFVTVFGLERGAAMTYQTIGNGSALCRTSADYFKEHGAFCARPEQGDVIFFYVNGDINHQGIVVRVDGGSVHTVEGNSSDMVAERVYSVSDSKIVGYGRPNWAVVEGKDISVPTNAVTDIDVVTKPDELRYYELRFPYLQRGNIGESVEAVQIALLGRGYGIGLDGADGDYGGNTETAVKRFQTANGLMADGIVGPDTGAALFGVEVYKPPKQGTKAETPEASSFWNNLLTKIRR